MPRTEETAQIYENLALQFDRHREPRMRDWFLLLAADAALAAGTPAEANRLRALLLARNPHHLISPFASFAEALNSPDIKTILSDLRRKFPPAVAQDMWHQHQPAEPALEFDAEEEPASSEPAPIPVEAPVEVPIEKPVPEVALPRPTTRPRVSTVAPVPEEVEVYRLQSEPAPAPTTKPAPQLRPATPRPAPPVEKPLPPVPAAPVAPPKQPVAPFPGYEPLPRPHAARPKGAEDGEAISRWVARGLACAALALGLGWLIYTTARPFLPAEWFR